MIKKILLSLVPPIFKIIYFRIPFFNFKFYWKNVSKKTFPKELVEITDKFIKSKSYKEVSNYWHYINISHYKKLSLETMISPEPGQKSIFKKVRSSIVKFI